MTAPSRTGDVRVTLAIKTVNESNQRGRSHWPRTRRTKAARDLAGLVVGMHLRTACIVLDAGIVVTLTRITPDRRGTLDDDGVCSALKATRDGVADALGVTDRDPRVSWRYGQRTAQRRANGAVEVGLALGYGVEVRVVPATAP